MRYFHHYIGICNANTHIISVSNNSGFATSVSDDKSQTVAIVLVQY